MNEVTLPSAPNWYLSTILSCASDGTVAWGARNSIVIGKPQENGMVQYSFIDNAHLGRVTSVAFCPEYGKLSKNLIVTGGDDHFARIWNVDTLSAISAQSFLDSKQQVVAVDWSRCDPDLVCFVSREGLLMSWTLSYNAGKLFTFGKLTATCLACSPHKSNVAAIGTKNGLIYVVNLQGKGTVNYKLRGHDVEIASLSWCPIEENVLNEHKNKDMLLASGAKDRSIYIWRAGGDGRYHTCLTLPASPIDNQQHRVKLPATTGNFTVVCWAEPKLLIACSSYGEVMYWNLSMTSTNKPTAKILHGKHSRGVFCIANVPKKAVEEENWRDCTPTTVWTLAQDRQVIRASITASGCNVEYSVPTLGGYVYCIAACPFDTSRIAFGSGDAMLRLWNLSEPHETSFDVTVLWQKIMGKVRSIDWHPEKENLLAFGTGDGRVGVWDINSISKPPTIYCQYHRQTVYSLGWGPNPINKNFVLYSCGDNELVYYPSNVPKKEATPVIKKGVTEFSWKPDYTCLAVGYEDGSVSFLDRNLNEIGTRVYVTKKSVESLAWHPESTSTDLSVSPFRNYLAVAASTNSVTILDLTDLIETIGSPKETKENSIDMDNLKETMETSEMIENATETKETEMSTDNSKIQYKVIAKLCGHTEKINSVTWSPHFSGHLATGSYDRTVQVWKVETQEVIATYSGHTAPVLCCMWSPLDPDYMMTGSSDFTVRIWKISDQKAVLPSEQELSKRTRTKKKKTGKDKTKVVDASPQETKILGNGEEISDTEEMDIPKVDTSKTAITPKLKKDRKKFYLAVHSKRMNDKSTYVQSLRDLAMKERTLEPEETNDKIEEESSNKVPTIFGNQNDLMTILDEEISSHVKHTHYNMATEMSMWNNSLRKNVQEATKERRLNDFLVSLSAGLSMKTWQETCEAYANQLLFESNPTKAVSYFLSVHKIHRAIEVFIDQKMYKEAYTLARCRVDEEDPIFGRIFNEWVESSSRDGNFEEAAQCCLKMGDFTKAAKFLGQRKDVNILEVAAEFGRLSKETGLCETLAERAFHESLLTSDVSTARRLTEKFSEISHRRIQVEVFDELREMFKRDIDSSMISHWLVTGTNFNLLEKLRTNYQDYSEHYNTLTKTISFPMPENEAMLLVTISHDLAMYAIANEEKKQLYHLLTVLEMISRYEIVYRKKNNEKKEASLLIRFLVQLENKRPQDEASLFQRNDSTCFKSLRAFLCLGILNWLADTESKDIEISDSLLGFVEKLLGDTLDKQAVRFWTIANEINKLETTLRSALGKPEKTENAEETKQDTSELLKKLDDIRNEKKIFLEERVFAPSPIIAYSKANQLMDILPDGNTKNSFMATLTEIWRSALS